VALAAPTDVTAPVIVRQVTGTLGDGGWFRGPMNVHWNVSDPESPWTTGGCDARTVSDDTAGMTLECRASSLGGTSSDAMLVRIDSVPPAVSGFAPDRPPDRRRWYNHPVSISFSGIDALSGLAGCVSPVYAGPDAKAATVAGGCRDVAGNESPLLAASFRYDASGPQIRRAIAGRRPDHRRWYRRPIRFSFRARDAVSRHARCKRATYRGPDGRGVVTASCTDRAGNVATKTFPVRFDATPPSVALRIAKGGGMAVLRWRAAPDARRFILSRWVVGAPRTRTTVYRGARHRHVDRRLVDRRRYRYKLIAIDRAGNRTVVRARVTPRRALLTPAANARLTSPPLLRWTPVSHARYYNVQLARNGGRTILSRWPVRPRFRVPTTWTHKGRRRTLVPGTYTWFVWAALSRDSRRDYGLPIGRRVFEIAQTSD
jgi:hypothetical protein